MLVNLKITTIGKVISTTLFICLVLIAVKTVNFSDVFAAGGPNATVTFVPDGPSGSNVFKVMLDPDGNDVNGVTIKFDAIGADSSAWNYFDCETQVNCTFPQGAVLTDAIMGNKTVTLINLGSKVNVATHLFTLSLSKNDIYQHIIKTEVNGATIISLTNGETKAINAPSEYTIIPNQTPTLAITPTIPSGVSYNTNITLTINDTTDNKFTGTVVLCEGSGGCNNVIESKYTLPAGASSFSGFAISGSSNPFTLTFPLMSGKYLEYGKSYTLTVTVKDDQNGLATQTSVFTTQADQTPPPKQLEAKIDKYGFGTGINSVVVDYSFKVNPDIAPGKLSKAYVFAMQDVTPGVITNSITGLSYSTYSAYSGALNGLIANSTILSLQSYLSMVNIPTGVTSVSGNITASRFKRSATVAPQILDDFRSKLMFLVVVDENGNYSDPVHLVKPGDVRGSNGTYTTGGFPDGVVSNVDALYLLRNFNTPVACPLPPNANTNLANC